MTIAKRPMKPARSGLPSRYLAEVRRMHAPPPRLRWSLGEFAGSMFWVVAFIGLTLLGLVAGSSGSGCGTYVNSGGYTVSRPCGNWLSQTVPSAATARCRDGRFSFSQYPHADGTCSGHWGVASYL